MAQQPEIAVLREALRQGERVLGFQDQERQSVLRRAGELLRLSIASLGGVIVIAGILSAITLPVSRTAFWAFVAAVLFQVTSTGLLAVLLSGGGPQGNFAFGPDSRRIATHLQAGVPREPGFLMGLVRAQPAWIEDNHLLLQRMQRVTAASTLSLAFGAVSFLIGLFFILGGKILA